MGDFCFILTKKEMPDGTTLILGKSVDHPSAPITHVSDFLQVETETCKMTRGSVQLVTYSVKPLTPTTCEVTSSLMVRPQAIANFLLKNDWLLLKKASR